MVPGLMLGGVGNQRVVRNSVGAHGCAPLLINVKLTVMGLSFDKLRTSGIGFPLMVSLSNHVAALLGAHA